MGKAKETEQRVVLFFEKYPKASLGTAAKELNLSKSTVGKYKPTWLKEKPLTGEELTELVEKMERQDRALEQLPWDVVKEVRNANGRLYPIDWERVQSKWKYGTLEIQSKEEFQEKLKELCDSLYDWGLYEECPVCGGGMKIPVWGFGGYTPFCGCSNYPKCTYSADREGTPIA